MTTASKGSTAAVSASTARAEQLAGVSLRRTYVHRREEGTAVDYWLQDFFPSKMATKED